MAGRRVERLPAVEHDGRMVAVKAATDARGAARILREVEVLAALAHPGVVELVAAEDDGPWPTLRTRWVEGPTFGELDLPADEVAGLAAAVATTLADLHERGVVHGSVAPEHVLVDPRGRPVLCGFGSGGYAGEAPVPPGGMAAGGLAPVLDPAGDVAALGHMVLAALDGDGGPTADALRAVAARAAGEGAAGDHVPPAREVADAIAAAVPGARLPRVRPPASPLATHRRATAAAAASRVDHTPLDERRGTWGDPVRRATGWRRAGRWGRVGAGAAAVAAVAVAAAVLAGWAPGPGGGPVGDAAAGSGGAGSDPAADPDAPGAAAPVPADRGGPLEWPAGEAGRSAVGGRVPTTAPALATPTVPASLPPTTEPAASPPGPGPGAPAVPAGRPAAGLVRPTACPPATGPLVADVDGDGCPETLLRQGPVLVAGERRWEVGQEGDQLVVGDWACTGRRTLAVLRPASGEVFRFDGWPEEAAVAVGRLVGRVGGARALRVADLDADGCHELVVETDRGAEVVGATGR